jgi:NAD(P)H-hydrate epimerase
VLQEGLTVAIDFAKERKVTLLLKGASSIVTDGRSAVVVSTGNSGLAKGGSGDVLSGVIVGLCASGASAFDGAVCGSFLVGKAAELGALEKGEYSLTASDVISYLGGAFLAI